nr:hypothetical protein [Cryobacterium gelidum]
MQSHSFVSYVESALLATDLGYRSSELPEPATTFQPIRLFAQLEAVQAGAGIGLLPNFLVHDRPEFIPVLPDDFQRQLPIWAVVRPNRCALQWCAPRSRPSRSRSPVGRPLSMTDRTSGYLAHPRRNDGPIEKIRPSFPCDKLTAAGSRGDRSDLVAERDAGGAHARVVLGNERGTGILEVQQ